MRSIVPSSFSLAVALLFSVLLFESGCSMADHPMNAGVDNYGADVAFAKLHTPIIELSDASGDARLIVAPALQGRVLTSTPNGSDAAGCGWLNKPLLESGKPVSHINAYGGEDRFWIGPEGGQFSIFFAPGAPFDLDHWQTPAPIDTEPFDVFSQDSSQVTMRRVFQLTNYSGTKFDVGVSRQVRLLTPEEAWKDLNLPPADGVKLVAYESDNKLSNAGAMPWTKETGLLSIWILGQFNASPDAVVLMPYKQGPEAEMGKEIESGYFGSVPADRLQVKDGMAYFRADARYRAKIGVSPSRVLPVVGSYDSGKKLLTLMQFTLSTPPGEYVNSQWKMQDNPFSGDVANSYNDGPNSLGSSIGNFYEMESSSPAAQLAPGESIEHVHRTIHLTGAEAQLDQIAASVLGIHLADIPKNLPSTQP